MNKPGTMIWLLAALLILPCARTNAFAQQNDAAALLMQGDRYAAEGKFIQARDAYESAIASGAALEKDSARCHSLALWYMNAEPHDYAKAAKWLDASLRMNGDDEIRLQLAQVLSWDGQFSSAIEHYQQLVRNKPQDLSLKRQLARVLSWSKRFAESLSIYDQLQSESPKDDELLVEHARVLSWTGNYSQAAQTYSEALKYAPDNADARLGQAQVLYWSGHPEAALSITRELVKKEPPDANASFLMAALEHNRGQEASALHWLQHASPDKDTKELRSLIVREMRPVLHLRFGFADDREDPTSGTSSTYRTLRYTSSFGFNVTKRVRMEVANTVTQNATSTAVLNKLGPDSLAVQTAARLHFSLAPWLRMSIGAGEGSTGLAEFQGIQAARRQHWLYDFRTVMSHGGVRVDLSSARTISDYTPLAVHENLLQRREAVAAAYTFAKRVRIGAEYWYSNYDGEYPLPEIKRFKTHSQGGSASFYPILCSSERWGLEAGVRYELFQFADATAMILDPVYGYESTGVFMPRLYQRYAGAAHLRWAPHRLLRIELDGTYGPQRVFGFASLYPPPAEFGDTGSFGVQLTIPGARVEPYASYDFFTTDTPASPGLRQGTFSSNSFAAGLRIRF